MGNGGGVMTTAGGLVFQGRSTGHLHVYRADNGDLLTTVNIGTSIMAAPMTYELDGVQYVCCNGRLRWGIWRRRARRYCGIPIRKRGPSRCIETRRRSCSVATGNHSRSDSLQRPSVDRFGAPDLIEHGYDLFKRNCNRCHANETASGTVPDLRRMTAKTHAEFADIVLRGKRASKGMGSFAAILSEKDVDAIHAAMVDAAWQKYERENPAPHSTPKAVPEEH